MYFLIYGDDTYRSRKKLAALRERFSATRDASGMNVVTFRHGAVEVDEVAQAIYASPFLADKKMVILEGFLKAGAADQEKIGAALKGKPESTVVMAYEALGAEALVKAPLFADLRAQQYSEECPALSPASAERFVSDEAVALGAKMEPRAARLLVSLLGVDSWQLHQETAKIAAYALAGGSRGKGIVTGSESPAGVITEKIVGEMVADGRETEIFAFLDACAEGRARESSGQLEKLLAGGASPLQIVSMLLRHYRAALAARDLIERGSSSADELARQLGMHPFPAGKALAFARRHGREGLERAYERLVAMERAAKSGGPQVNVSLSMFAAGPERA
ncbi:MAG: hypothetical protein RLZZ324_1343 [Candidatus Parcubacteria bacterium]|jgi:DNA polymerase-3 subunit delta